MLQLKADALRPSYTTQTSVILKELVKERETVSALRRTLDAKDSNDDLDSGGAANKPASRRARQKSIKSTQASGKGLVLILTQDLREVFRLKPHLPLLLNRQRQPRSLANEPPIAQMPQVMNTSLRTRQGSRNWKSRSRLSRIPRASLKVLKWPNRETDCDGE